MAETQTGTEPRLLPRLLEAAQLGKQVKSLTPMIKDRFVSTREDVSAEERLLSGLAAVLYNLDESQDKYEGEGARHRATH